jgi:molybdopterin molybdotransferase
MACNVPGSPGKALCQPVTLRRAGTGYIAEPVFGKSGMIAALTRADGFMLIGMNTEGLKKDEPVWVFPF